MQLKKLEPGVFREMLFPSLSRTVAAMATGAMPPSWPRPCRRRGHPYRAPWWTSIATYPPLFPSPFSGSKPPPFSLAATMEPTSSSSNRRQLKPRRSEPRSPSAPPHRRLPPHRRNRAGRPDVNVGVLDVVHLGRRPPGANTGRFRRPRLPLAAPALPINSG